MVFDDGHTRGRIYQPVRAASSAPAASIRWPCCPRTSSSWPGPCRPSAASSSMPPGSAMDGQGLVFAGPSEAGKSTMVKLIGGPGPRSSATTGSSSASDAGGFRVHGTWNHGEIPRVSPGSAPVRAVFFLRQARDEPPRPASGIPGPSWPTSCPGSSGRSSRPTGWSGPSTWPARSSARSRSTSCASTGAGPSSASSRNSWRQADAAMTGEERSSGRSPPAGAGLWARQGARADRGSTSSSPNGATATASTARSTGRPATPRPRPGSGRRRAGRPSSTRPPRSAVSSSG
ncbi:MAG: hypothetical protein MZV64_49560 [Ignavibacteriales bacterium]|nr:hypothetical protein [Ignavibacteriales bacterium]